MRIILGLVQKWPSCEPQIILAALVVVATVIGLDVVIKGLGAEVMGMEPYLMARLAHGVLCGFTFF